MANARPAVVIHIGSGDMLAGFAGDAEPSVKVSSAEFARHGVIEDWAGFEKAIAEVYSQLGANPERQPVLMSAVALNPAFKRQKMLEVMYEKFRVPGYHAMNEALLSLFASGRTTGLVVLSGQGGTYTVPIEDGYPLMHATIRLDLAKVDVDRKMQSLLKAEGKNVALDTAGEIVAELGYISTNYEQDMKAGSPTETYRGIAVGKPRFAALETMFKPELISMKSAGLAETAYNSVMKCDVDLRPELYSNVVLAGVNTRYPGMAERMKKELASLAPSTMKIKIIASPERHISSWIGGSIFAEMSAFPRVMTTLEEYEEHGSAIALKN
ncbi:hypothetical protein ACWJJH_18060 [Endozoicomonadaceae bacterium StTr2]